MQTVETPIMTMADDNLNIATSFLIYIGENTCKARSFMSILYALKVSYNQ